MNKKDFPLIIHQELNQLRKAYSKYFKSANSNNPLMRFEDNDQTSDFFFLIDSFKISNYGEFIYDIKYKPITENNLNDTHKACKFADVEKHLNNWVHVIQKFDETQHFNYDPIVDSYIKEYFDEYKLLDDDADIEPFNIKQQLLIDEYLDKSIKFLETYEAENGKNLDEPKSIAIELRSKLTQLTKNEVIKQLSKLWAESRKKGIPILKEILYEFAKDVIIGMGKELLGLK